MSVTALYAAPLALMFVVLAVRVIRLRRALRVAVGDGGDAALARAVRAHANFAEYVPLGLLLLWMLEHTAPPPLLLHALGATLLVGRVVHALGLSRLDEDFRWRVTGMSCTFGVLAVAAVLLLARTLVAAAR